MARARAANYDVKRGAMLRAAARLFAEGGFERTTMVEIAVACGVSKALLYHYYSGKDDLLFDIVHDHIRTLAEGVEAADDADAAPPVRLSTLIATVLEAYRDADAEHRVQIAHMRALTPERQATIKAEERRIVAVAAAIVKALDPGLSERPDLVKPLTMSLFGILNWHFMWFREDGALTRAAYVDLATRLFLDGVQRIASAPSPSPPDGPGLTPAR